MTKSHLAEPQTNGPSSAEMKRKILVAISDHMVEHGRHHWNLVRERPEFAPVIGKESGPAGQRKFYRWVAQVSQPIPPDKTRPHEARQVAENAMEIASLRARSAADQNLPAVPTPSYFLRAGADAERQVNLLAVVNQTLIDAERLRDHAMRPDENTPGGAAIANEKAFDASIRRRLDVVQTAVNLRREIYDLEYYEKFYRAVGDIIIEELSAFPEVQGRVIERLAEFSRSQGMVVQAEIR